MVNSWYRFWLKRGFYSAFVILVSCTKQEGKTCWHCTYQVQPKTLILEYCDKTKTDIQTLEQAYNGKMSCVRKY